MAGKARGTAEIDRRLKDAANIVTSLKGKVENLWVRLLERFARRGSAQFSRTRGELSFIYPNKIHYPCRVSDKY
jgi:hypothetical protein